MANYLPLKKYIIFCMDKIIDMGKASAPFLDVGCGNGDISEHLAKRGWNGKAIDFSDIAIEKATYRLSAINNIKIEKKTLSDETGTYNTILMIDVLEHIAEDDAVLNKTATLLPSGGHLILTIPSNPSEWRWDDELYGHFRRYTIDDITQKLTNAGFTPKVIWDVSFPLFWLMRRASTKFLNNINDKGEDKTSRTKKSSAVNAWGKWFVFANIFSNLNLLWRFIFVIQFRCFKNQTTKGNELIILAIKA